MAVKIAPFLLCSCPVACFLLPSASKFHNVLCRARFLVGTPLGFASLVQIDDFHAFGPIICSGRTTLSNVASSTKPSLIASSFKVVPFLWAVFATVVALS